MGAHLNSVRIFFLVKEEIQPTNLFIVVEHASMLILVTF